MPSEVDKHSDFLKARLKEKRIDLDKLKEERKVGREKIEKLEKLRERLIERLKESEN